MQNAPKFLTNPNMNFSKYFAVIAIVVLCLAAASEASFISKAIKSIGKAAKGLEKAGNNVIKTTDKTVKDIKNVAGAVGTIGALLRG